MKNYYEETQSVEGFMLKWLNRILTEGRPWSSDIKGGRWEI